MKSLSKRLEKLEGDTNQEPWIRVVRRQMMALEIIPEVELPANWNRNIKKLTLAEVIKFIGKQREMI